MILDRATCKCGQDIFYQSLALPFTLTTARLPLPAESIWNAASFYQESSYLYFPTLQAELASDISFYFKSSAPSGVFLENLGLKDFIRLELTCESTFTLYNRTPQNSVHGIHDRDAGAGCVPTQERAGELSEVFLLFSLLSGTTSWSVVDSFISSRSRHAVRPSQHDVILMTHSTTMSRCGRRH